jgi:hypothetical protein
MSSPLAAVVGRFPSARARAEELFERDEDFREVCEEYEACRQAEVRLTGRDARAEPLRHEYEKLRARLEQELSRYLEGQLPE